MRRRGVAIVAGVLAIATAGPVAAGRGTTDELPPARGEQRRIVGILDVRVEGMGKTTGTEFERELESLMTDALRERFWIGSRQRMEAMLAGSTRWMKGCFHGPCLREVRTQTGAELVLTVYLQGMGTTYRYVITLLRTDTGEVVEQRSEACAACTQREAITQATTATLQLVMDAPDLTELRNPAAPDPAVDQARHRALAQVRTGKRRISWTAMTLVGLAALGGGLGGYWLSQDRDDLARPALGLSAGLAVSGVTLLVVNLTWD